MSLQVILLQFSLYKRYGQIAKMAFVANVLIEVQFKSTAIISQQIIIFYYSTRLENLRKTENILKICLNTF